VDYDDDTAETSIDAGDSSPTVASLSSPVTKSSPRSMHSVEVHDAEFSSPRSPRSPRSPHSPRAVEANEKWSTAAGDIGTLMAASQAEKHEHPHINANSSNSNTTSPHSSPHNSPHNSPHFTPTSQAQSQTQSQTQSHPVLTVTPALSTPADELAKRKREVDQFVSSLVDSTSTETKKKRL